LLRDRKDEVMCKLGITDFSGWCVLRSMNWGKEGGEEGEEEKGKGRRWKEMRKQKLGERKESGAIEG
jgi:hypothetical protein